MEVQGFDLMAQIEAMLRHVRQYQRDVQRLRGITGKGQTTSELPPVVAVQRQIRMMLDAQRSFADTLSDVTRVVDSLARPRASRVKS